MNSREHLKHTSGAFFLLIFNLFGIKKFSTNKFCNKNFGQKKPDEQKKAKRKRERTRSKNCYLSKNKKKLWNRNHR